MSTIDDKTNEQSENAAELDPPAENDASPHDEQSSGDGPGGPIILFFLVGLAASLILGWVIFPQLLYSKKQQPFDFNHVLHMEEVDGCESCHFFREDGTYAGIPTLEQCVDCHEEVQGDSPDEEKFVEEYVKKEKEVPWLVYSRQPDCVFFSHAAHVLKAEIDCAVCHGPVGQSESLKPYEENRITGYSRDIWGKSMLGLKKHSWDRMKMDDCAECHAEAKMKASSVQTKKDACFVCHK
jgi:hypothetical protein